MRLGESLFFMKGRVWHTRHKPVRNAFKYSVAYLVAPLSKLDQFDRGLIFGLNRPALISLYAKDYGARGEQSNRKWVAEQFTKAGQTCPDGEIVLVAMPRCLGYVFNPVCFWLCFDSLGELRGVVTEVNNTFSETHIYLCAPQPGEVIQKQRELDAKKVFHVSPFFTLEGGYKFRFDIDASQIGISINYYSEEGDLLLSTRLAGPLFEDSPRARRTLIWHAPLLSLVSMTQILWQAVRLKAKGMPWINKPKQLTPNFSTTNNLNNSKV